MVKTDTIIQYLKDRPLILIAAIIVLIGIILAGVTLFQTDSSVSSTNMATFTVKKGPLMISVIESGTIKSREQIIIKNEVEGKTSILSLVQEGSHVKKGDLLVELDASKLLDNKIDQQIKVQNTEATYVGARENLAVIKNQARSDVDRAKLTYDFAKQDLNKYLKGEYPNQLKEAESQITLADEEVTRARNNLEWSKKLYNEKYISYTELQADELAEKKKVLDLELAKNNLDLLKDFTYTRNLAQLESDVSQAEMALERTTRKANADVVQAEANLAAKKAEFERQKDKLKKIETQLGKTKLYAPADALVIYATSAKPGGWRHRQEPLEEGQDVRERQELIYLPTASSAMAEVDVHEASLDKVRVGLPVRITIDALPGKEFTGRVANIAPLPDARSAWMNPDLKVYNTDIYLDNNSDSLRTGMSCKAEIVIEQHREAIYVPIQAVLRVGTEPTVYVVTGKTLEPRKVKIGLDNNRMIHIISGLEPGEVVTLTPPLAAAAVAPAGEKAFLKIYSDETKPGQAPASSGGGESYQGSGKPGQGTPEGASRGGSRSSWSGGGSSSSSGQSQNMVKVFQNMSSEEREKFRSMSSSEKREFLQKNLQEAGGE